MSERTLTLAPYKVRVSDSHADAEAPDDGGPPLLLVNGIGANLEMWEPLRRRLSRRTIALDLPGTGGSSTPLLPLSIPDTARLLLRVLDDLGIDTVDVLGFSFGGSVAQELAHLAPSRVRRLVLVATSCGWGSVPGSPLALAVLSNPLRYYSPSFFKSVAPVLVGGRGARNERFLDRQARKRAARPPSAVGYWYQLYAASTWSSWPWLHTLRQPTLVLTGDRDQVVPAVNARMIAWAMPSARLRTWKGGGHMLLLDSASRVAPEIEEFLAA
ncbi:MAG: alpha/beta hydrolase [Actinomycetota bacterium]|nr:alpha/beta hydrolase [Actinomycetota bacterium]